jgi:LytTr DNA-binding domain
MADDQHQARRILIRQVLIDLAIMTGIGLLLALIGPFGTFAAPFAWRLVYWTGLAWGGYACYRPIGGLITRLGPQFDLPEAALWVVGCLIATVPMTVLVWLVGQGQGSLQLPSLDAALMLYGYVLVIGIVVTLSFYLFQRQPQGAMVAPPAPELVEPETAEIAPVQPRLFDRLPPRLGTELVALEMEDHYLRVHTALGSDLILLRMRDALAELDGLDGAQVHRSWWVARTAVRGVLREGRNVRLELSSGLIAPVARNMVPTLKSADWI